MNKKHYYLIVAVITLLFILVTSSQFYADTTNKLQTPLILYSFYYKDYDDIEITPTVVDKNITLKEKIQWLADDISAKCFENLDIKVESIEDVGGKQIAYINLIEKNNATLEEVMQRCNRGEVFPSWYQYAQGSTGSDMTLYTITETLLQRYYKRDWVDGIKLLYNGSTYVCIGHMECMDKTVYR